MDAGWEMAMESEARRWNEDLANDPAFPEWLNSLAFNHEQEPEHEY